MSSDDRRFVEVEDCPQPTKCKGWHPKSGAEPFSILTQGVVTEIYRDYDNDVIARIAIDVPTDLHEAMIVQIVDADTGDTDEQR